MVMVFLCEVTLYHFIKLCIVDDCVFVCDDLLPFLSTDQPAISPLPLVVSEIH